MRKITSIENQKKNPDRVNIYLDGQYVFSLSRFVAGWLKFGQQLSDAKIESLQLEDSQEKSIQKALRFLEYRNRSTQEVRKYLEKNEFPEIVIQHSLQRLSESNLLNDFEFAKGWVDNRNSFRPRGRKFLEFELRHKGLSDELIQTVLDENVDEATLALEAAKKYLRKLNGLPWLEFRQKLGSFLSRRGFSYAISSQVTRSVWNEMQNIESINKQNENKES